MTKPTNDNQSNHSAPFAAFFKAKDSGSQPYCSVEAALKLGLVQPHEDPECLHTRSHGKLPYSAAISMGIIDKQAAEVIKAHPNVHRLPRGVIEYTAPAAPRGPLSDHEGTPVGAVAAALQRFVSTRSDADAAGFAKALEGALRGR
jgi:hypothetical protein